MISVITAFNSDFRKLGAICLSSMIHYELSGIGGEIKSSARRIPGSFDRPASWFKLPEIKGEMKAGANFVLWVDADAIITGKQNIQDLIDPCSDLTIATDENGINCGVMAWRSSEKTLKFLDRVWEREEFIDHPWWEQAAIADMIDELSVSYVDKSLFNAYPSDATEESGILHWPGMSIEEREPLMAEAFNKHWLC
jgi:hypothetical protein